MRIRISLFPKILDSTFPIASEEPGPGAFRCPGSPQPTTPPPLRARNVAAPPRGRPAARLARSCLLGAGARPALTRASPAAGALRLRRESRRPAEARRGRPGTALPPAGAARAPPTAPPPPQHAAGQTAALPPACEHRARHQPWSPDEERGSAPRQVMDPRGNSVLPPAAAPSAGSLRPPPPPPSSAAAAAGKGAEETASLPLPTAHAHLSPTVRKSATSERRVARAPSVTSATRRGRGYGGSGGSGGRLAEPAGAGLAVRPPVALPGSPLFSLLRHWKAGQESTGGSTPPPRLPRLAPGHPAQSSSRSPQPSAPGSPFYSDASRLPSVS